MARPPLPPTIPGTTTLTARAAFTLTNRFLAGCWHGTKKGNPFSAALLLTGAPLYPLLVTAMAIDLARPNTRYYATQHAHLAVTTTPHGWRIENHSSDAPGTGQGRALRDLIIPKLLGHARQHQIPVYVTAANQTLAAKYAQEVPQLHDAGPGFPRGRRLTLSPAPAPKSDSPPRTHDHSPQLTKTELHTQLSNAIERGPKPSPKTPAPTSPRRQAR